MVNDPGWTPTEGVVLDDVRDLHQALYDKLSTIAGILGLEFKGFDSGRSSKELPSAGIKISLVDWQVDRTRPTPQESHRLLIESGVQQTYEYEGETYTEYPERVVRYPLPVNLMYRVRTWCHSAETQLAMDQGVMQTFPERGVLQLPIGGESYDFPIELTQVQTLGDLADNKMERVYQFKIEAWIRGTKPDGASKLIFSEIIEFYQGNHPGDANLPENFLFDITLEAESP